MKKILAIAMLIGLMASTAAANTQRGMVNTSRTDTFTWVSDGGQIILTLAWLNGGADLVMALACGDGIEDPMPFGAAGGSLKRFARINAGVPAGLTCALAITAARSGSKYFVSFLTETDGSANGFGRINVAVPAESADGFDRVLDRQLSYLRRMAP